MSDDDEKVKVPSDQYLNVEPGPLPPMGPDGAPIISGIGQAPAVPPATPATFVCLRGPCRHYWEMHTFFASGNPAETWGDDGLKDDDGNPIALPKQINRACLAHPGTETELTEDTVYHCNRWDPLSPREVVQLERRRSKYHLTVVRDVEAELGDVIDDDHQADPERRRGSPLAGFVLLLVGVAIVAAGTLFHC